MTKKDYELIASVIAQFNRVRQNADFLADIMADKLASKNPRFNKEKFLQACGVEVKKIDYTCPKCKNGQSKPNRVWCDKCIDDN